MCAEVLPACSIPSLVIIYIATTGFLLSVLCQESSLKQHIPNTSNAVLLPRSNVRCGVLLSSSFWENLLLTAIKLYPGSFYSHWEYLGLKGAKPCHHCPCTRGMLCKPPLSMFSWMLYKPPLSMYMGDAVLATTVHVHMGCCVSHHSPCTCGMLYNCQRRRIWAVVPLDKSNKFIKLPINWLRSRVMRQSCRVRFLLSPWYSLELPGKGVLIKKLSRSDLPVSLSVRDCLDF